VTARITPRLPRNYFSLDTDGLFTTKIDLFSLFDTQEPGSSACSDCAPGLYSAAAAANCLSCPSGTFSTAYGSLNDAMRGITDLNQDANIDLDEFAQVSFTLNEFSFDY
jgi:hypothetical protein